ncbi:putative ribonuclease H-like domain-containing protein [Tanacetum coccineum]
MIFRKELDALALMHLGPVPAIAPNSTNLVNTGSDNRNTGFEEVNSGNIEAISPSADHEEEVFSDADDDEMPEIRIYDKSSEGIFEKASYDDDGIITDFNNLPDEVDVSTNHTLRIHNAHPQSQILGDPNTPVQTRSSLNKITEAHALMSHIQAQQRSNHKWEVYVSQPPGFVDPDHPTKVYKVVKALYGLHQAPRAWYATLSTFLVKHGYRRGTIDKTLFIRRNKKDIMLVQVYVDDIIFGSTNKSWCDEFEALMQSRFQMSSMGELTFLRLLQRLSHLMLSRGSSSNPRANHTWLIEYPRESPLLTWKHSLIVTMVGPNLDKIHNSGCEFLGRRHISWREEQFQCNTKIHIDNESTICIVKNPVYHSKTKHIEIRHHFIRDCYEKKLISVEKIHTDLNVADLLTKPFDGPRFNYLVVSIEEEPEVQGRKSQDDPLDSSVQGLVTLSTTRVNTSGEEQVEEISPNTLEATKTLSKVASLKPRSIDNGRRYKRRKEAKGKKVVLSLDFQEEVDVGAEQVNTAKGVNNWQY